MSAVTFKFPLGVKAKCKITNFTGTIISRHQQINGCIQYALQPPIKKGSHYISDAYNIDEENITITSKSVTPEKASVNFAFETGDRVKSRVNGFEGIVTHRVQFQNGCVAYRIEGEMKDGKESCCRQWEQEIALVDKGLNAKGQEPVKRKRTGGDHSRITMVHKAI